MTTKTSFGGRPQIHCKRGNKGWAEISVRDRRVERALPLCAFDVDVDPLAVAGTFGKLVCSGLIHFNLIRCSKALANEVVYVTNVMSVMIGDTLLTDDRLVPAQFPGVFASAIANNRGRR